MNILNVELTDEELNNMIAIHLGWYQLNGAWIHPLGYAARRPNFIGLLNDYRGHLP